MVLDELNTRASQVASQLLKNNKTLALAESCTGGLVSHLIVSIPGASTFFYGGVVSYSNDSKIKFLGVSPELIEKHGAVSKEVCAAMAEGIKLKSGTSYGLSITGIAGPDGGSPDKPVGTIWIGLASEPGTDTKHYVLKGDRNQIRFETAKLALELLTSQ